MATYIEIVNKVLRRMREPTVATVNENAYSILIGEFVNDAKRVVEDSWPWRALIDRVNITLVPGTSSYDIEDFNCVNSGAPPRENARLYVEPETGLPLIRITTDNFERFINVLPNSYNFIERQVAQNDNTQDIPASIILDTNVSAASGNSNMRVITDPLNNTSHNLQIYLVNPQNDLATDASVLLVPTLPVVQLAYLYSLYERGEEIGETLTLTSEKAKQALSDAIAFDSSGTSGVYFSNPGYY